MMNNKTQLYPYTPERITTLQKNEIFVFGSNPQGVHNGGAARYALDHFGAIMGQGVGMQGQSYAIPTTFKDSAEIKPYVDDFIAFARINTHLLFFVTPIGCGIAGFSAKQIALIFTDALNITNIILPKSFYDVLKII